MKLWSIFISIYLAAASFTAQAFIGNTNNGTSTDTIWSGPLPAINSERYLASSNETVNVIYAKVGAISGHYKCAIYTGSSTYPTYLLRTSSEVTNPTNGWYAFSLTNAFSITNGAYYWFAIWSESSAAKVYYSDMAGQLNWMDYAYGNWPAMWNNTGSSTHRYCIYATKTKVTPPPASTNIVITLSWLPIVNPVKYEVWSSTNIMVPFTLYTNAGLATNVVFTYPKVSADAQRYYYVKGYFWQGTITNLSSVVLAWDYICGTTNDVAKYNIYYGVGSRTYTNMVTITYCTNRTGAVSNLLRGVTYYFSATAVDKDGLESDYSSEVSTSTPPNVVITNAVRVPVALNATR